MQLKLNVPVITLDGPSGTGKGTLCHMLAERLGWHFLDSGAIYRVLAYAVNQEGIAFDSIDQLITLAHTLKLRFAVSQEGHSLIFLDDVEISHQIRSEQCGQNASKIAVISEVRVALLARQRAFAVQPGLVTDGRDMGTVVFPDAILKIYLFASAEERAMRRYLQLQGMGNNASLAQVVDELSKRDERDMGRMHSPLMPADDAIQIDTTGLTIDQVFNNILEWIKTRAKPGHIPIPPEDLGFFAT
ncbi:(d)CMP kinase [bacterium]|nr:(d)CMP kinase [bacterium]